MMARQTRSKTAPAKEAPSKAPKHTTKPPSRGNNKRPRIYAPPKSASNQNIQSDLFEIGMDPGQVREMMNKREEGWDQTMQRPFGESRDDRQNAKKRAAGEPIFDDDRPKRRRPDLPRLVIEGTGNWVLYDPNHHPIPSLTLVPPPAIFEQFMRYEVGNRRIVEFNLRTGNVRIKMTPKSLRGKTVEYTDNGPKIVGDKSKAPTIRAATTIAGANVTGASGIQVPDKPPNIKAATTIADANDTGATGIQIPDPLPAPPADVRPSIEANNQEAAPAPPPPQPARGRRPPGRPRKRGGTDRGGVTTSTLLTIPEEGTEPTRGGRGRGRGGRANRGGGRGGRKTRGNLRGNKSGLKTPTPAPEAPTDSGTEEIGVKTRAKRKGSQAPLSARTTRTTALKLSTEGANKDTGSENDTESPLSEVEE